MRRCCWLFSVLLGLAAPDPALANDALKTLYSFCAAANCADGQSPVGTLAIDKKGNLYGTTTIGGANTNAAGFYAGTVFEVTKDGNETVLYNFCSAAGCADGFQPIAGLIMDGSGNLFGTAGGGTTGNGVVFEVSRNGTETVLYSFCPNPGNGCTDGTGPSGGLILDSAGNLYGTTLTGGANGEGVVFEVSPAGQETVLYSFCARPNCADGQEPEGGVVADAAGNLYGTTFAGGFGNNPGVVFELTASSEQVLYNFCQLSGCTDGETPLAGVILDAAGNLFGTTQVGGANASGTVFEVTPAGAETVLYNFCSAMNCEDGVGPFSGLVIDKSGNLYGTSRGGTGFSGTLFEVSRGGAYSVLHDFCTVGDCLDGDTPNGTLLLDGKDLYGVTAQLGANGGGTVFKLTPK
jgi:uncharacterized repeat protein (TIGR03803 family)